MHLYSIGVLVGIITALGIAASNASYLYIFLHHREVCSSEFCTVLLISLQTATMDTSLIFSAVIISRKLFNFLCLTEDIKTVLVGVAMAVYEEVEFSLLGFFLVISASAIGGYRWSRTQVCLSCFLFLVILSHFEFSC